MFRFVRSTTKNIINDIAVTPAYNDSGNNRAANSVNTLLVISLYRLPIGMRNAIQVNWPSDVTQRTSLPSFGSPIFTVNICTGPVPEQKQVIRESGSSFGICKKAQCSQVGGKTKPNMA